MWERPANIPALVRLLCAYLEKGKPTVLPKLESLLGVFQKLLASRATDAHACKLLGNLFRHLEAPELAQFAAPIFQLSLTRLQSNKKVAPHLVACWAVYVARYGAAPFRSQLDSVQPSLTNMLLRSVWAEALPAVAGARVRKAAAIATARLLTECPEALQDAASFAAALRSMLLMLLADGGMSAAAEEPAPTEVVGPDEGEGDGGYAASYNALTFASAAEPDLYPSEASAAAFVTAALRRLHASNAAVLPAALQQAVADLDAEKQEGVRALMQGIC